MASSLILDHDSGAVQKIIGVAGAGKTRTLLDILEEERDTNGVGLLNARYLSFTKAACSDIQEKIGRIYPDASTERCESSVRTTHSCALSLYNDHGYLDDDTVIISLADDPLCFAMFFSLKFPAIPFSMEQVGVTDPFIESKHGELALGNRLIFVYNYLQSKCWEYGDYRHAPIEVELPEQTVVEVFRAWDRFKEGTYLQHDDYVRNTYEAKLTPSVDVLFIDEFQDLSPLQYALYKTWRDSEQIDRIYIAGDPDQSIYGFRGAEAKYLAKTPVDEVTRLSKTWRCPEAIVSKAKGILGAGAYTDIEAREAGGIVRDVSLPSANALAERVVTLHEMYDEVYLLARTNRQVGKIAHALRTEGIPYVDIAGEEGTFRHWRDPAENLLIALRAVENDESLNSD